MIALATPRLVLRPWTANDLDALVGLAVLDPDSSPVSPSSPTVRAESFLAANDRHWHQHGLGSLAVEGGGSVVGGVGVRPSRPGTAGCEPGVGAGAAHEIAWALAPSARGRGYATEAGMALMDWVFGEVRLQLLLAVISREDESSRRVATRLGMTVTRRIVSHEYAGWVDLFGIERSQWDAS